MFSGYLERRDAQYLTSIADSSCRRDLVRSASRNRLISLWTTISLFVFWFAYRVYSEITLGHPESHLYDAFEDILFLAAMLGLFAFLSIDQHVKFLKWAGTRPAHGADD